MKRSALLLLTLLVAALPAVAQEVPVRLTLADALRIARARNPAYLQVLNDVGVAAAGERAGWGAFLPSLSANLSLSASSSKVVTGQDDFGRPIDRDPPLEYKGSSTSQSLGASLTLFDGGRRLNRLRAARAESRATDARVAAQVTTLRAAISRAYYLALRTDRLIDLEEQLLEAARQRLAATERMLRVVAADPVDVLGAQVEVARQEQAVQTARGEMRKAQLALGEVMGVEAFTAFELVDPPPAVFAPGELSVAALVREALAANPAMLAQRASVVAAERQATVARGSRWPTLDLGAGFSRSMSLQSYGALDEFNPPNQGLSFGLSASLPLFSRFQTSSQIATADAAAADAREALRAERLRIEREVRSAYIDLENAYQSLELAERSVALSRERLELAQEQYRLGAISFTDLQNVTEQAARTERDVVGARFGFVDALVNLEERIGKEVRP